MKSALTAFWMFLFSGVTCSASFKTTQGDRGRRGDNSLYQLPMATRHERKHELLWQPDIDTDMSPCYGDQSPNMEGDMEIYSESNSRLKPPSLATATILSLARLLATSYPAQRNRINNSQTNKQYSKQTNKQTTNKQTPKQTSKQANKQTSKQQTC